MILILHVNRETAEIMVDGRLLVIPPDEAWEVPELRGSDRNNNGPYEYIIPDHEVALKIKTHGWYHGIVDVPVIREGHQIRWDVEAARVAARTALALAEDTLLASYVRDQQERVKEGKAALPPGGRIAQIIERRGIDLRKEFNIDPPGWAIGKLTDRDAEIATLKRQLAELMARFAPAEEPAGVEETGKRKR